MRTALKLIVGTVMVMAVYSPVICAGDGGASIGVDSGAAILSKYVWRGILLTDDPVLQPGITVGYCGFSGNVWGNMDLGDVNGNNGEFNELDFTADYSAECGGYGLSAGIIHYAFPNTDYDPTTEFYVSLTTPYTKGASLTVYHDIGEADGTYTTLGYDASIPLGGITSMNIGGSLGYCSSNIAVFYYGCDGMRWSDIAVTIGVPFEFGNHVSVTPVITFSSILNGTIRDVFDEQGRDSDNLVFGVSASASF